MKLWLDTTIATQLRKEQLDELFPYHQIAVANTAVDIEIFQQNLEWFEEQLENGTIVVEMWNTLDEMTAKPFYWSSCGIETAASDSFEKAVMDLPNGADILDLADLIEYYGIPKGQWKQGPWSPPAPLNNEHAAILGVNPQTATRTDILAAAKAKNRMDIYDEYNIGYNRGLTKQHLCDGIILSNGNFACI